MKHCSQAFLVAAALAAALTLTGCELPDFVYGYCADALAVPMGEALTSGQTLVESQCRATFHAPKQINLCVNQGVNTLNQAMKDAMPQFTQACGSFVKNTVCVEGSTCADDVNKITPDMVAPAVAQYVATNKQSLLVRMEQAISVKIRDLIAADYNQKFSNRVIPSIVQAQCSNDMMTIGTGDVMVDPTNQVYSICSQRGGSALQIRQCQDGQIKKVYNTQRQAMETFKKQCAKAAILVVCPTGSACAIETSQADTTQTQAAVSSFIVNNFNGWLVNLKAQLMQAAGSSNGHSRLFEALPLPAWQGSGLLALISLMAVGGIGCAIVAIRYVRKSHSSRTTPTMRAGDEGADLIPLD